MNSKSAHLSVHVRHVAPQAEWKIDRRDFLKVSSASLFGLVVGGCVSTPNFRSVQLPLRFGLITDPHYADTPSKGKRFYRESLGKVREAVDRIRAERVAFLAELGDFKDMEAGETAARTLSHLIAIEREFQRFGGPTYHVLGNHDMDNLSKTQVMTAITNTGIAGDRTYYGFSKGRIRFIVLDATFDQNGRDYDHGNFDWKDANVPPAQLDWLAKELTTATDPVIVFVHQRLDGDGHASIKNRAAVRARLESSGKVLAVFQGHDHPGAQSEINGIHYYTLKAVVEGSGAENNSYAVVEVAPDLGLTVTGFRRATGMMMSHGARAGVT